MKPPRPYATYDVLSKWESPSWDSVTRAVLRKRLSPPRKRTLDPARRRTLEALCETVLPQPDRPDPIPVAALVEAAIEEKRTTGTRWEGIPPMREAWDRALTAVDAEAKARSGRDFHALDEAARANVLRAIDAEDVQAAQWDGLAPREIFRKVILDQLVRAYYAHPHAWSEIGFGGPASPRGYVRLAAGRRDSWEAPSRSGDKR